MRKFGLIGFPLIHSFSKKYFTEKFEREGISDCSYENYQLEEITGFPSLFERDKDLEGINVTIPYKEQVIPYLDLLSGAAAEMKAVNCIRRFKGKKIGYNTDVIGFENSLLSVLKEKPEKALILGTGGASKAIAYVLGKLGILHHFVSRKKIENGFTYEDLNKEIITSHLLIVNTTPLGTFPKVEAAPNIPYEFLTGDHILHDLVYNPKETKFLRLGKERGAVTKNGYDMLIGQAEASWEIWNKADDFL